MYNFISPLLLLLSRTPVVFLELGGESPLSLLKRNEKRVKYYIMNHLYSDGYSSKYLEPQAIRKEMGGLSYLGDLKPSSHHQRETT